LTPQPGHGKQKLKRLFFSAVLVPAVAVVVTLLPLHVFNLAALPVYLFLLTPLLLFDTRPIIGLIVHTVADQRSAQRTGSSPNGDSGPGVMGLTADNCTKTCTQSAACQRTCGGIVNRLGACSEGKH
jgi:hypothetical protein